MKNELAYWLAEGKPYKQGVKIYSALIGEASRVRFFNSGSGKMQQQMLYKELIRYARVHAITPRKRPAKPNLKAKPQKPKAKSQKPVANIRQPASIKHQAKKAHIKVNRNEIQYDDLPKHLQYKFDQNSAIWSRIQLLHAKMQALSSAPMNDEQRRRYLKDILSLDKVRRKNWNDIDQMKMVQETIKPTGRLTLDEINTIEDEGTKAVAIDKRIEANLMYIRRYHDTQKPRQMKQVALRIEELEKLKIDYETRIKTDINIEK